MSYKNIKDVLFSWLQQYIKFKVSTSSVKNTNTDEVELFLNKTKSVKNSKEFYDTMKKLKKIF